MRISSFAPMESGCLDYSIYIKALKHYAPVPYFVFEYYRSREDMLWLLA